MSLLGSAMIVTTVAVSDLDASGAFFRDRLGLELLEAAPFAWRFGVGDGGQISVRKGQPNIGQTVGHFEVDDLDAVMGDLRSRGVTFEEYESPKTVNGVAQIGPARGAWFKDLDGNVFGLREGPVPGR
jgi:catechol 2,3-dioxygenase-like lactoylglutathione lyase family enzyme